MTNDEGFVKSACCVSLHAVCVKPVFRINVNLLHTGFAQPDVPLPCAGKGPPRGKEEKGQLKKAKKVQKMCKTQKQSAVYCGVPFLAAVKGRGLEEETRKHRKRGGEGAKTRRHLGEANKEKYSKKGWLDATLYMSYQVCVVNGVDIHGVRASCEQHCEGMLHAPVPHQVHVSLQTNSCALHVCKNDRVLV